jgi:hypothetical protein
MLRFSVGVTSVAQERNRNMQPILSGEALTAMVWFFTALTALWSSLVALRA